MVPWLKKAVIPQGYYVPVPEGVDAVIAAALPASALISLFPLKRGVKLQPGETVLINGATGVSGKYAVQIAKLLGAGRAEFDLPGLNQLHDRQRREGFADRAHDAWSL